VNVVQAVADQCLAREVAELDTGWEDVLVPFGLALAGQAWDDARMLAWARRWIDHHGEIELTQYCGDWGAASLYAVLDDVAPAVRIADHICAKSPRLDDGTIMHHGETVRAPWVDTLYYTAAPLARVFQASKDERYAVEAVRQCLLHAEHLRDPLTGCFVHDPTTGWLWSRGNGWVIMAFADVLRFVPPETAGRDELLALYRELAHGLLRLQHPSGLWRIVPDDDESHLETSGSLMIATGLAVGIAGDLLDRRDTHRVLRTWRECGTWVDQNGAVLGCQSPAGLGGWETHKLSAMGERTYGTGSYLRLAAELRAADLIDP
jgi:rhamnogalacturonyl hydrolase YesR